MTFGFQARPFYEKLRYRGLQRGRGSQRKSFPLPRRPLLGEFSLALCRCPLENSKVDPSFLESPFRSRRFTGVVPGLPFPGSDDLRRNFNRGLRCRNDSSGRLSSSHGDGDVHGIPAVLVLRRDTTDHRAIDSRDARTIRGRVRPVW